jgi:hypothetical protein
MLSSPQHWRTVLEVHRERGRDDLSASIEKGPELRVWISDEGYFKPKKAPIVHSRKKPVDQSIERKTPGFAVLRITTDRHGLSTTQFRGLYVEREAAREQVRWDLYMQYGKDYFEYHAVSDDGECAGAGGWLRRLDGKESDSSDDDDDGNDDVEYEHNTFRVYMQELEGTPATPPGTSKSAGSKTSKRTAAADSSGDPTKKQRRMVSESEDE